MGNPHPGPVYLGEGAKGARPCPFPQTPIPNPMYGRNLLRPTPAGVINHAPTRGRVGEFEGRDLLVGSKLGLILTSFY